MEKNKTGKYLKYAIGEIVLVVIGILIALSINNWNDYRKDRIAEKELYETLIRSLESDLEDVQNKYVMIDSAIIGQKIFITESLDSVAAKFTDKEFFDLLFKVGNTSKSFVPNLSVYNKIMNDNQIDLVQSKDLQTQIMKLYEEDYWEYKDLDATLERQAHLGLISNFFGDISHMFIKENMKFDPDSFREHYSELNKKCRKIYFLSLTTKESMLKCENKIKSLLKLLNEELKK